MLQWRVVKSSPRERFCFDAVLPEVRHVRSPGTHFLAYQVILAIDLVIQPFIDDLAGKSGCKINKHTGHISAKVAMSVGSHWW